VRDRPARKIQRGQSELNGGGNLRQFVDNQETSVSAKQSESSCMNKGTFRENKSAGRSFRDKVFIVPFGDQKTLAGEGRISTERGGEKNSPWKGLGRGRGGERRIRTRRIDAPAKCTRGKEVEIQARIG